jgi:hypothetical protein
MSQGLHGCERMLGRYNTKLFQTAVNSIKTPGLPNERQSSKRRLAGDEQRGGDRRPGGSKADDHIDLTSCDN